MSGVEGSTLTDVAFWVVSILAIGAAVMVVTLRDIFRAALFLALSLLAVAGMFVLLRAEFIAVVQVLVYVGAISILIVFAIVLVRDIPGGGRENHLYIPAATIAALVAAMAIFVAFKTDFTDLDRLEADNDLVAYAMTETYNLNDRNEVVLPETRRGGTEEGVFSNTTGTIGGLFIRDFVLPFEAVSVLLLAAMIASLALLRQRGQAS